MRHILSLLLPALRALIATEVPISGHRNVKKSKEFNERLMRSAEEKRQCKASKRMDQA